MGHNLENKEKFEWIGLGAAPDMEPHLLSSLNPKEAPVIPLWDLAFPRNQCETTKGKPERNILDL